ncbi:MAG: hypothetical protein HYX52_06015 [Chloroflexi bacterium]|nr:hypothetical protein [Chloroflexota bacterium]
MFDLLMENAHILTVDANDREIATGWVGIEGNAIAEVSADAAAARTANARRRGIWWRATAPGSGLLSRGPGLMVQ